MKVDAFYEKATGFKPYPYQSRLATSDSLPALLNVPTGVGKTAASTLAWVYRRRFSDAATKQATPRRLVYCLPMRTLVEQTRDSIRRWLKKLDVDATREKGIAVHVLMGGEDDGRWYEQPEADQILIGTQDMLLSRALNRGYGMSRYAWPVHFALLNNDCLWVLDETQLMGVGLTTSAQLAGLREKLKPYGVTQTLWMSATLDTDAIISVDHPRPPNGTWSTVTIEADDKTSEAVSRLLNAKKPCSKERISLSPDNKKEYAGQLVDSIVDAHVAKTLTLVVINRVTRAQNVFESLNKRFAKSKNPPEIKLIHARFRPADRAENQASALVESTIPDAGRIIVSTQAVEAGVDISATTLFSELSPWSSMVQRFGRCNRRGKCGIDGMPAAQVRWIDINTSEPKRSVDAAMPYEIAELDKARNVLETVTDVGPHLLSAIKVDSPQPIYHVLRRKDLLDLFDTTADLSGNDLDVSRYIRDSDDIDVQVYWRDWDLKDTTLKGSPPAPMADGQVVFPAPDRHELCSVSIAAVRGNSGFIEKAASKDFVGYKWDSLKGDWQIVKRNEVLPGMVLMFHSSAGGYDSLLGWTGDPKNAPVSDRRPEKGHSQDAMDGDELAATPLSITDHLRDVGTAAESLESTLRSDFTDLPWRTVVQAAWWHDIGKAHPAFQGAVIASNAELEESQLWAKSGKKGYLRYQIKPPIESQAEGNVLVAVKPQRRRGFRHELASALAWLQQHHGESDAELVAYLIAAHHGKVRLSIRSMPNENRPPVSTRLFARGIWDRDILPAVEIGNAEAEVSRECELSLDLMQLGERDGRPSWLARSIKLRDQFGPFRLAFLETLVRVADWRGSQQGESR